MNFKRLLFTAFVIYTFALLWNGVVHGVILAEPNLALKGIVRPAAERSVALSLLLTAGIALLFVFSFAILVKGDGVKSGVMLGAWFGVLAGLMVDLNQFLLYPIPGSLALTWSLFGFVEFCLYGLIAAWLYKPPDALHKAVRE